MKHGLKHESHLEHSLTQLASTLIDQQTINTYIRLGDSRESDVLAIILNKYLSFSCHAVKQLQSAMLTEDFEQVHKLAHTMKSSAAQVGASRLSSQFREIEKCVERGNFKELDNTFFQKLEELHDDVTDALIFILENREQYLATEQK